MRYEVVIGSMPEGWGWLWQAQRVRPAERARHAWLAWWPKWRPSFFRRKPKPKALPSSGAERRESFRYGIGLETSVRLIAAVEGEPLPVRVRNISAGGISLVVHREVATDTILVVQLLNRPQMFLCDLQVRVTYVVEHPSGDWIIGGAFTRKLNDEELRALLS